VSCVKKDKSKNEEEDLYKNKFVENLKSEESENSDVEEANNVKKGKKLQFFKNNCAKFRNF